MKRILLTGMSGTGKSTVIFELAKLGYKAVDLDNNEFSQWITVDPGNSTLTPEPGRDWVWRSDRVQDLLSTEDTEILFVSGCAENMGQFLPAFDHIILLSSSVKVIIDRLATRTNNSFGKQPQQVEQVLALKQIIEPRLRKAAGYEIDTNAPLKEVVASVLSLLEIEKK